MRILYVGYPLQPVCATSCGGAEQVLWTLEREISERGVDTTVCACEGSAVSGKLVVTGAITAAVDSFSTREAQHTKLVLATARSGNFDLIHDHSGHFWPHARALSIPVLSTLHLPRSFYNESAFTSVAPNVFFACVSDTQSASFGGVERIGGVVPNGIALDRFPLCTRKNHYLLWLGRICPEKAPHIAMDLAMQTGLQLVIAGQVYPFSHHQHYFEHEVRPRLKARNIRFVEAPSFAEKLDLLQCARALVISSLAQETSSMVALEAQACGTPVVALQTGALPEVINDGVTGFLVDSPKELVPALGKIDSIDPRACRALVENRYTAVTMADGYESLYREILASSNVPTKAA